VKYKIPISFQKFVKSVGVYMRQYFDTRNCELYAQSLFACFVFCNNIHFFFLWRCDPTRVMASSFLMFLDHTQRRTTVGLLWTSDQLVAETST